MRSDEKKVLEHHCDTNDSRRDNEKPAYISKKENVTGLIGRPITVTDVQLVGARKFRLHYGSKRYIISHFRR